MTHDVLEDAVRKRREREEQAGHERSFAQNLAMIGALGWLIVVPALIGVFAGRWLDRAVGSGIMFSSALLFAGIALGGWLAWKRMNAA
jgi:ATP synthase protein I